MQDGLDDLGLLKEKVKNYFAARKNTSSSPQPLRSPTRSDKSPDEQNGSKRSDSIAARLAGLSLSKERRTGSPDVAIKTDAAVVVPHIPKSLIMECESVLYYMQQHPKLPILFLDIRARPDFESCHISAENIASIDPLVCRENTSIQDLEDSFAVGPEQELELFKRRQDFELIIYYDHDSRGISPTDAGRDNLHPEALQNLQKILWERMGWKQPLRRPPVFLVGGLSAWVKRGGPVVRSDGNAQVSTTATGASSRDRPGSTIVIQQPVYSSSDVNNKLRNRGTTVVATNESAYPRSVHEYIFSDAARRQSMIRGVDVARTSSPHASISSPPSSAEHQSPRPLDRQIGPYLDSRQLPDKPRRAGAAPIYSRQPSLGAQVSRLGQTSIGKTGLKNLGNSCFMNAVLQCLAACYPLARYFTSGQWKNDISEQNPMGYKGLVAKEFGAVLRDLSSDDHAVVVPVNLRNQLGKTRPEFANNEQQDAQELLNFLLDAIHEDLNANALKPQLRDLTEEEEFYRETLDDDFVSDTEWKRHTHRNMSIIVKLFQGQLQSRLKCMTCGHTSTTYNAFSSLSLPLPAQRSAVTLEDCVNEFVKSEGMTGDDSWYCAKCKTKRNATKKLTISKLPDVLIIHFKRFESKGPWRDKLNTSIDFPLTGLDMTKYLGEASQHNPVKSIYDVFGIVYHRGSMEGGHYTAMVNPDAQRSRDWTLFDDSRVAPSDEIDRRASYLLFYAKRPDKL